MPTACSTFKTAELSSQCYFLHMKISGFSSQRPPPPTPLNSSRLRCVENESPHALNEEA